ncbi:MAG: hypothetical protein EA417_05910 [Gammaproteobacteria bacterium]|nr:MAG: hypothetical protein EA417_05910 [Gammaproteobacteria bacterium]
MAPPYSGPRLPALYVSDAASAGTLPGTVILRNRPRIQALTETADAAHGGVIVAVHHPEQIVLHKKDHVLQELPAHLCAMSGTDVHCPVGLGMAGLGAYPVSRCIQQSMSASPVLRCACAAAIRTSDQLAPMSRHAVMMTKHSGQLSGARS